MKKILTLLSLLLLVACDTLKIHIPHTDHFFPEIPVTEHKVDIVLVLGGGAVRGLAHLGVLEELENAGIVPDLIVGCSAGAIVGAFYADYPHAKSLKKKLFSATADDFMSSQYWPSSRFGLSDGTQLENYLKDNLKAQNFKGLMIPLVVIATDLGDGKLMELHEGEIATAVRASAAFPGAFEPVFHRGKYLIDGGVLDNVPIQTAKKFNPKIIIAVDVGETLTRKEPTNLFGILRRALEITYYNKLKHSIKEADILISMDFEDIGLFDESRKQEIYDTGRQKARESMPAIKALYAKRIHTP